MSREESRWTYLHGSRPEGCVVYDNDTKIHIHHDSCAARGQNNSFDLVRLCLFGELDKGVAPETPVTARASYARMVEFANQQPEVIAQRAGAELEDLGPQDPLPRVTEELQVHDNGDTEARFRVIAAGEFSSGAPMEWIVRGVLPRAELAVVYGDSGSGKTFLALDLCGAISRGVEWRSKRTEKGRVVYVCAEGAGGFKARLRAYARGHSVELAELPAVIADAPNLLDPKDAAAVAKAILDWAHDRGPVDVVVIDTLSATTPGGNENSGEDMGLVLSHCKFIHRNTGALVVLIHHSGKDATKGARGWSGLRAAADAEIEVSRNGDYRAATITKMKDGSDGEQHSFKLKVVPLGTTVDDEEETSCVVEHVENAPEERTARKTKLGPREGVVLDIIKTMAPSGTVAVEDVLEAYRKKVPRDPDKRDQRRSHAATSLTNLVAKGVVHMHGEDRVSLTSLITSGGEGWLE